MVSLSGFIGVPLLFLNLLTIKYCVRASSDCVLLKPSQVHCSFFFFFCYWRISNLLGWTNPFGSIGKPNKLPCSSTVVVQFQTYNFRVQNVIVGQLSYPWSYLSCYSLILLSSMGIARRFPLAYLSVCFLDF